MTCAQAQLYELVESLTSSAQPRRERSVNTASTLPREAWVAHTRLEPPRGREGTKSEQARGCLFSLERAKAA